MAKPVLRALNLLLLVIVVATVGALILLATGGSAKGWPRVHTGIERRVIEIRDDQGQQVESVYVWRLDQRDFRLDVAFADPPRSLQAWQTETKASMVVNGGYFSVANGSYSPDGLTVIDGKAFGSSFEGYGGMLAVHQDRAELRSLAQRPYDPGEPLQAALQSFPVLVQSGGRAAFGAEREDYARARRTVIGQDKNGRILFIVAPEGHFTLHELSAWLAGSDLGLDMALNLDGGGSTGAIVADPPETIPSKVLLPFVILVYPR